MKTGTRICAIAVTIMMIAPTLAVMSEDPGSRSLIRQITTLGDDSEEDTIIYAAPGKDTSPYLRIPNGATIISATFNISGEPYTPGGKEYPENVTLDVGDDGDIEWAFEDEGYGRLGHQYMISNSTNFTESLRIPFFSGGTNDTIMIRLPKEANITKAALKLEGSKGTGPSQITTIDQMQSWAPNMWVTQGNSIWVNELNGQILYDSIQFDIGNIPDTAFVSNATFWWGRKGTSYYGQNPGLFSFDDDLEVRRIEESWSVPTTKKLKLSSPPEDTNAMVDANVFYDWNVTQIMASWVEGIADNNGLCIHRDTAADRDKWDYSLLPYINVKYGSPGNVSLILKDSSDVELFDHSNTFDTSSTVPDFSAALNGYLATHPADLRDSYGNAFVDVPFTLSSTDPGRVTISDIDIAYNYNGVVDENPTTVNLTKELDELVPDVIDGGSTDITLAIFSNHSGKVKISGVRIDFLPPDHSATIDTHTPEEFTVVINENETIDFEITASDLYDYPLTVVWYMDGEVYIEDQYNMTYYADFESAGSYNITVIVNNELYDTTMSWNLVVKNVNRKPLIDAYDPEKAYEMDENSTATFNVTSHDPDGDPVMYKWYLDDVQVGSNEPSYDYRTDFFDADLHQVKVTVVDPKGLENGVVWDVLVNEVNAPPVIVDSNPKKEVEMYETETKVFTVKDQSLDGDDHDILWFLDGNETGVEGKIYEYHADYNSSGMHMVEVEVTDGELSARRTWDVTVIDVNRPPVPQIDAPENKDEFLDWDDIVLDGSSTWDPDGDGVDLTWSEGPDVLGTGEQITIDLEAGKHTITLTADDGRESGEASTDVMITVRYIEFDGLITTDAKKPVEDDMITVSVQLTNEGDGAYGEMEVFFLVDGKNVSSQMIQDIEPDGEFFLDFEWKAEKGDHTFEIVIGDQNFTAPMKVAKKPIINKENSWIWATLLIIILVVAIVAAMVLAKRRKRAEVPSEEVAPVVQPVPHATIQAAPVYPPSPPPPPLAQPVHPAPPAPLVQARPVTPLPPPPAPYAHTHAHTPPPHQPAAQPVTAPATGEEMQATEMVENTEEQLHQYQGSGDVQKASRTFRIAKNFYNKGNYQKAIYYCQKATGYLE